MARKAAKSASRKSAKPVVLITGLAGNLGMSIAAGLKDKYRVVGLDVKDAKGADIIETDLTSGQAIEQSMARVRERFGNKLASVIHLAAYFDFTGEPHPLYDKLNVAGTRKLMTALQGMEVEQVVYSGTMLIHKPVRPGSRISEKTPLRAEWAYPKSKLEAEKVIREHRGDIPAVLLHLAGLYDEDSAVPTLAHQVARIYERDLKSRLYSGDPDAGQAVIHRDDLVDLFRRTVDRRKRMTGETVILAGEEETLSYEELQDRIGCLVHGETEWETLRVPAPAAKAGAYVEEKSEPIVPDAIDQGEKPFIRPFMVDMASDHYALDCSRAQKLLGWRAKRSLREVLPDMVAALKKDPLGWYEQNGITAPDWLQAAADKVKNPEKLRARYEERYEQRHYANFWAPWLNVGLGTWLVTAPPTLGYTEAGMIWSDVVSGLALVALGFLTMSPRFAVARWLIALIGVWLLFAPLALWTASAAAYLNGTLAGALAIGFAVLARPAPGVGMVAAETGPTVPPGWEFSPSSWFQRLPIIILAFVGLYFSRYLAAYQLGHIDSVWEPFFPGTVAAKNGTEDIVTSSVSEAWPVPDAGAGALVYMLEILTGVIGSSRRWRTMPWLVTLFGVMIVPLGAVSITFIIIQPIVIGTWCTLCLVGAAAMLVQIPYSLDELVATGQFLWRRKRAGRPLLRVFFAGDTDKGPDRHEEDDLAQGPAGTIDEILTGGVGLPWNLALIIAIGTALMFSRMSVDAAGLMADTDHLLGALIVTVTVTALAEVARPVRFLNVPLALGLIAMPFFIGAPVQNIVHSAGAGVIVILLSIPRGAIRYSYGAWDRFAF